MPSAEVSIVGLITHGLRTSAATAIFFLLSSIMGKHSTIVSSSLLVAAAIAVVLFSIGSSARQIDLLASNKQRSTLLSMFDQHGVALARELKVQTFWTEGYRNAETANVPWMREYFGAFLDRVLGYSRVYVLNSRDRAVYAFENGSDKSTAAFESRRNDIGDLIALVRSESLHAKAASSRVQETIFSIGGGQRVIHRAVSDVRLFDQRPSIVIVSTILPDAALDQPMSEPPPLMVATHDIDDTYLRNVGTTFGISELSWSDGKVEPADSFARVTADNGALVGVLHWHSDHPGVDLERAIAPGMIVAMSLFLLLTGYFLHRSNRQAGDIEAHADALAIANQSLEQRVSERTKQLEVTLANLAKGIVLMSPDGRVIMSNAQSKSYLEVETDDELAEVVKSVLIEADPLEAGLERRRPNVPSRRKDRVCPSGRIVEVRSAALANAGSIVTINDVTALKRRQAELEAATAAANAASDAKSRFLSTMSHEMRTPLNGLIGALDLVQKTHLDTQQQELVSIALQASEALLVHISDVLDFSKLEAGKFELDVKPFDLHRMAKSVAGIVTAQVESQHNRLMIEIAEDLPRHMLGDSVRLRQIILNYVTNANKFTRHGTIKLTMKCLATDASSARIHVSVADTGIGIPKDRVHDLFQEFSMIESGYTRKCAGTGLGLAISKRLAEAMGGSVGVESEIGKGSTFWFEAILQISADGSDETELGLDGGQAAFSGLKLLLVDDNATNRLIGSKLLNAGGHFVSLAQNGREAVEAARKARFDAILMDISMPEMDGLEATRLIRAMDGEMGAVPIIALTANAIIGDREKFLCAGMDDYLTKPFRLADIQQKLTKLILMPSSNTGTRDEKSRQNADGVTDPIFDASELEQLSEATTHDVVIAAADTYLSELKRRESELNAAIEKGLTESIKDVCHAIAGASRTVGAQRLGVLAKAAEVAFIESDKERAQLIVAEMMPVLSETETAISAYRRSLQRLQETNAAVAA